MNQIINLLFVRTRFRSRLDMAPKLFALPLLALMLLPSLALANIYRCVSDSGVVTYSDVPCGKNAVVAFEKQVMDVDNAASRDVIMPTTDRTDKDKIINALTAHGEQVGSRIFPNKKLTGTYLSKIGRAYSKNDLSYSVNMRFVSEDSKSDRVVRIFYEGRMADEPTVKLKTIKIFKDNKPFYPLSMQNLKRFRKINYGEWGYQK